MKRMIALLLSIVMLLSGCGQSQSQPTKTSESDLVTETEESTAEPVGWEDVEPQYDSLDDEQFLAHIEDLVYSDTVASLNSDEGLS